MAAITPFGLINWNKKISKNFTGLVLFNLEDPLENEILYARYIRKKVPRILITSWITGYFIKVDINTKLIRITKIVYPQPTPKINGIVFFIPKLKPENDATALLGPGVKPKESEIPTNNNNSEYIKFKLSEAHFQKLEMGELI